MEAERKKIYSVIVCGWYSVDRSGEDLYAAGDDDEDSKSDMSHLFPRIVS